MVKKAIFPGSFDPFHKGHEFVVNSALKDGYNKIYIIVSWNKDKKRTYTYLESVNMIRKIYKNNKNISVLINDSDLTVNFARKLNCFNIIRGYRNNQDLEYEKKLKKIYSDKESRIKFILYKSNINISSKIIKNDII